MKSPPVTLSEGGAGVEGPDCPRARWGPGTQLRSGSQARSGGSTPLRSAHHERLLIILMLALTACRTTSPSLPYHQVLVDDVGQVTIELPGPDLKLQQSLTQAIEH